MAVADADHKDYIVLAYHVDNEMCIERVDTHGRLDFVALSRHPGVAGN